MAKFLFEERLQSYNDDCKTNQEQNKRKFVCFILHVDRHKTINNLPYWYFNFLSGWELVSVDSLERQHEFSLKTISTMTISQLFENKFHSIEQRVRDNLMECFNFTTCVSGDRSINKFYELYDSIQSQSCELVHELSVFIMEHLNYFNEINSFINSDKECKFEWLYSVATDFKLLNESTTFMDAISQYLSNCVKKPLAHIVYQFEELSAWYPYLSLAPETQQMWRKIFKTRNLILNFEKEFSPLLGPRTFKIDHKPLKFMFPFSQFFYKSFQSA